MHLIVDVQCGELWETLEAYDEARDAVFGVRGAFVQRARHLQALCLLRIG